MHWCFQLLLWNQGLLPVSDIQLTSRCAGPGREHRQTAKLANGNVPYHRHHVQFMNTGWPGPGISSLPWARILFYPLFEEFELFHELGLFSMSLVSFAKFACSGKSMKFVSSRKPPGLAIAAWELLMWLVVSQWEKIVLSVACLAYSLLLLLLLLPLIFPLLPY